jgi:hypothetical protein
VLVLVLVVVVDAVVVGGAAVVDVVVVVVVPVQICWIPRIFSPGGMSEEIATPSGMLNTRPPMTVTRSSQLDAAKAGDHIPSPPTATPADINPTSCLRLRDTLYNASRCV